MLSGDGQAPVFTACLWSCSVAAPRFLGGADPAKPAPRLLISGSACWQSFPKLFDAILLRSHDDELSKPTADMHDLDQAHMAHISDVA